MKIFKILFFYGCICVLTNAFGQDSTAQMSIKISPQHLLVRALRLDFDYRFAKSKHALVLGSAYYTGLYKASPTGLFDEISGFGFELSHKIFLTEQNFFLNELRFYASYGLNVQQIKAKIFELDFCEKIDEDGLNQIYFGPI